MMEHTNSVSVLVPLKAEYVSIIRLTASGIASRIGFDFDVIEDIKVAISEVISKIIEKQLSGDRIEIQFDHLEDGMTIHFKLSEGFQNNIFDDESDNFAFAIISSLMDEVMMQENDKIILTMTKKLERAI